LKVLHLNTERTWRGGEQQTLHLAAGLGDRGHESQVLAQPGRELARRARERGLVVRELSMRGEWDLPAAFRLRRLLRRERYDVLHMHTSHAHTLGVLAGAGLPARRVVSRRVDFSIYRNRLRLSRFKYRHGVHRYVAISEAVRAVLVRDGIPASSISIVPSGIDATRFPAAEPPGLRAGLGLPAGAPVVLNVAHMAWHKAQEDLIRALPAVLRAVPDAVLVIAGDGERRGLLESEARRLGVERAVRMPGFRTDVPELLALCDVFALSSVMEGLCTSILDALSSRKAVVAPRAGGIPEIVRDGVEGLLVPPGDPEALGGAIARLLRDPELRRALGARGPTRVAERFTVDRMVEGTLRVYEELLQGAGAQGALVERPWPTL